ncbi:MAG: tetratricopeptide repeat protein [Methylocella sp.]
MQFLLGFLKESGLGFSKNIAEAHDWYRRSGERGFAPAQYMLFYANGPEKHQSGTDNEELGKIAVDWCRKAAVGGFAPAQLNLSFETPDPAEAHKLRLAAAEQGYARAASTLGDLYREGLRGSAPDLQTAFTWFKKAAELGDADSAAGVGWMLREGTGVAKDEAAALQWFLKAFEMKSPEAAIALGQIYAFGMLDQPKDSAKSKFYHAKSRELRKWWAESHGFPDKKPKTFLQKILGIVRKASRTGSI